MLHCMDSAAADATPLVVFTTRTNTELGAQRVLAAATDEGAPGVLLQGVLKRVTEAMLVSHPRAMLGKWVPNRAALLYPQDEIPQRNFRRFEGGAPLTPDALLALAAE